MGLIRLPPREVRPLCQALLAAFPTEHTLDEVLVPLATGSRNCVPVTPATATR